MDMTLTGKRALVCGSSKGIGRASAEQIASLGAHVTLVSRTESLLSDVASALPAERGQRHDWIAGDSSKPEEMRSLVEARVGEGGPYHILVNNSGGPPAGRALDADLAAYEAAFRAHILCNQALVQSLVPRMKEAGYGRIVNVISTSVKTPIPGLGVSNTIRGAVASWAKTLATELAPFGITVNNVLPGFTDTERLTQLFEGRAKRNGTTLEKEREAAIAGIPAGRLGLPEEVGAAVAFLCTPAAAYINGINVPVDGGRTPSL